MSVTYGDAKRWQSEPLGTAGDSLKKDLDALEGARDQLETQGVPESWTGVAVMFALARRTLLVKQLDRHIDGKRRMQRALYDAETIVAELERLVTEVEGEARAKEFSISTDGTVSDVSDPPTFPNRYEADEWSRIRQQTAQALADDVSTILGRAAAADATIAGGVPPGHVPFVDDYGVADPEVAEQWATMTDDERRAVVEEMIEEQAAEAGIPTPTITWEPETWGPWGEARGGGSEIALNEGILDDPFILNTVAHEMRHARQFEAIDDQDAWRWPWQDDPFDMHEEDGITEEQAEEWDENFDDYKSTSNGDTYEEYFEQPVEVDARRTGKQELEDMTEEELERLLEEGQR
ncbi:hypothetical protein AAII07_03635 [Microvirga sp. 0TCS3.31]